MPRPKAAVARETFVKAVDLYIKARDTAKAASQVKDGMRDVILRYMRQIGEDMMQVDEIDAVVTLHHDEKDVFDTEKAKVILGERAKECYKKQESDRVEVNQHRTEEMLAAAKALAEMGAKGVKIPSSDTLTNHPSGNTTSAGSTNKSANS
jgi:hypothetical protein